MSLTDKFDQVDMESAASPQHDSWHELRESLGQKVVATFHEGFPAEGSQPHPANVLTALKAAVQGHCTDRAQASGIANAVLVAWLQNMSPSQQTQTWGPQLMKAISLADLTPTGAVQVVEAALQCLKTNPAASVHALPVLKPALASLLLDNIPVQRPDEVKEDVTMTAQKYQVWVFRKVCQCPWRAEHIPDFLAFLGGLRLPDQLSTILKKTTSACIQAEAVDLPKVVGHIICISNTSPKAEALQAVIDLVDALEAAAAGKHTDERHQLCLHEGQILQWVRNKLPTNADLGQAWLKQLKGRATSYSAFKLSVLLIMSEALNRLQQPVMDLLQALVTSSFQADQQVQQSAWLASLPTIPGARAADLEKALLTCISNNTTCPAAEQGWGLLSRPIIRFAVGLLEKGSVKAGELADALSGEEESAAAGAPHVAAVLLGIKLLVASFAASPGMRESLLREVQGKLVGVKEEVALPFVAVLGILVHRHPKAVLQHANLLKAALDRFAFMTPTTALGVLVALQPLALLKKHIQAYMVGSSGVLRKALFSRGVAARLVAVRGLLYMIIQQLRTMDEGEAEDVMEADPELSCSQSLPASQQPSMSAGSGGVTLLHELMGLMRRSLTQQAPIRAALYQGVHAILAADPSVQESVLELLLPHFELFVQAEGPPLRLHACACLQDDAVIVQEPVDLLLTCVRQVLMLAQPRDRQVPDSIVGMADGDTTPSILRPAAGASQEASPEQTLQGHFSSLRQRLLSCELEDFGMDKDADWALTSPQGALRHTQAGLLLGCLEVVIEDVVAEATGSSGPTTAQTTGQQLGRLLELHDSLSSMATEGKHAKPKKAAEGPTQGATQKRSRAVASKATQNSFAEPSSYASVTSIEKRAPALSVSCLRHLLNAVLDDGLVADSETQEAGTSGVDSQASTHAELARSPATQTFILQSCLRLLNSCEPCAAQHAVVIGTAGDLANWAVAKQLLAPPDWGRLTVPLIRVARTIDDKGRSKGKGPGEKLPLLAVQCLQALLNLGRTAEGVAEVLQDVPTVEDHVPVASDTEASAAGQVISQHLPLLYQMLQTLLQAGRGREGEAMTHTLAFIGGLLPPALQQGISRMALKACQNADAQVTHAGASKALISLHLSTAGKQDMEACMRVSKAVEHVLGVNENPRTQAEHLQVTSKTGAATASNLFTHLEGLLHAVDWLLTGLAKMPSNSPSGTSTNSSHAQLEEASCQRLHSLAEVLSMSVACSLKGPPSEQIIKLLVTMYRLLKSATLLTKAPQKAQQAPPSPAFQSMVTTIHQQLTPSVYTFIFDASTHEDEEDQNQAPNAEKKARKAKKEGKQIGLLVKAIEEWEFNLIKLTRSCGINLMRHAKKSTNRDFRMTFKEVPESEPVEQEAQEEDVQDQSAAEEEEQASDQAKRSKIAAAQDEEVSE
ncbi:TPA: hypothetical protein ACH3X1_005879 [Trebouxia sp. C0004]